MSGAPGDVLGSALRERRRKEPFNEGAGEKKGDKTRRMLQVIDEMQAVLTARRATVEESDEENDANKMRAFDAKWIEMSADFLMCAENRHTVREHAKKEIQRFGRTNKASFDKLQDAAQEFVDAEVRERAEEREAERQEWVRQKQLAEAAAASVKAGTSKKQGRNKKYNSVEERRAARRKQQAD